jgi:hypothetical protein
MAAWLTSHWAHPEDDEPTWHLYRKKLGKNDRSVRRGDTIFFYECLKPKGQDFVERVHRNHRTKVRLGKGTAGIVRAGTVVGERRELSDDDIVYDYFGNLHEWKYITPCALTHTGRISLAEAHRILKRKVPLGRIGLMRITDAECHCFLEQLRPI